MVIDFAFTNNATMQPRPLTGFDRRKDLVRQAGRIVYLSMFCSVGQIADAGECGRHQEDEDQHGSVRGVSGIDIRGAHKAGWRKSR